MDAGDDKDLLLGFVDGTSTREESERLLDRMQEDPSLRKELETLQAVARGLAKLPAEAPRPDFARQFMARHATPGLLSRLKAWFDALPAPVAPGLALAGALGVALLVFSPGGSGPAALRPEAGCTLVVASGSALVNGKTAGAESPLRLQDRIEVDDGFDGSLVYPDGTRVKIRPGSTVEVRSRGLYLQAGGVWLNVTKDMRGFKVETPIALAAVKGTRFLVELKDRLMKVSVIQGLVEVVSTLESKLLGAGKGATVDESQQIAGFAVPSDAHQMFRDAAEGGFETETP